MGSRPRAVAGTAAQASGITLAIAAIGWFDYITGPDIAFSLFYLIPVAIAAWRMTAFTAWWAVGAAAVAWFWADVSFDGVDHVLVSSWNAFTRLVVFAGAVIAIQHVRSMRERERSEALARLRASEGRFRSLVESSSDWVWEIDASGRYAYSSPRVFEILGYRPDEIVGRMASDLMADGDAARYRQELETLAPRPAKQPNVESVARHKDGREVRLETSAVPVVDANGLFRGYCGIARDVTSRWQAEQDLLKVTAELHEARRMEAIGRLAGGIAHDFNNLLTVILGSADYLVERLEADEASREEAREVLKAGQRAAQLTRQLLAFGRRQIMEPRPIDLNTVVSDAHGFVERLIGEHVRLELSLAPAPVVVNADPSQITQVVANLAANARDAMPQGGTFSLVTRDVELAEGIQGIPPGRYAMLALSDTGVGMDAETQSHLFEPFFTTKDRARGAGLGLASVHGIIDQSGGYIQVRSTVGTGTTFEVYLPRVDAAVRTQAEEKNLRLRHPSGEENVLLVEDEPAVRDLLTRQLRNMGYALLVASGPEDAIAQVGEDQRIDLLITDVIMPAMSGPMLASRLASTRPQMRVLYVSGYPDTALAEYGAAVSGASLLPKPFSAETLAQRVRAALEPPPGEPTPRPLFRM